jgi:hypothetical protein
MKIMGNNGINNVSKASAIAKAMALAMKMKCGEISMAKIMAKMAAKYQ